MNKKDNNTKSPLGAFFGNWIVRNLLLTIFVVGILAAGAALFLDIYTRHDESLAVPDLTGMDTALAAETAARCNLRVSVTDSVYVDGLPRGAVYKQLPEAGSQVKKDRRISLTINANQPKTVLMPQLAGYSMRQAKAELTSTGLRLGRLIYQEDMATNNVLDQLYKGRPIAAGTRIRSEESVDLVVGLNPQESETYIPALAGYRRDNAADLIHEHSLNIGSIIYDNTIRDGRDSLKAFVYRQVPEPSQYPVTMGAEVTIYLTTDRAKLPAQDEASEDSTLTADIL